MGTGIEMTCFWIFLLTITTSHAFTMRPFRTMDPSNRLFGRDAVLLLEDSQSLGTEGEEQITTFYNDDSEGYEHLLKAKRNGEMQKNGKSSGSSIVTEQHQKNGNSNGYSQASSSNSEGAPSPEAPPEVNLWTQIMASSGGTRFYRANNSEKPSKTDESPDLLSIYPEISDLTHEDQEEMDSYWNLLLPRISYLGAENADKIETALCVAYRAHKLQKRKSGEPFIIHPVEVALLLSDLRMDAETIMSGLLHDTVEDTDLTFSQVEALFGPVVKNIVEGETKVSKMPKLAFTNYADEQAENLRQMFVAMTDDYRIIIVKLADRLHNMRTLQHMSPKKQTKISRETLDIFAPLAHRMGIRQFKSELEDTAFWYLYPQEYKRLSRRLERYQSKFGEIRDKTIASIEKTLRNDKKILDHTSQVDVSGRTKELYSLWYKMETKKEQNLNNIADLVAVRVVVVPKEEEEEGPDFVWLCYHVLYLVHHLPGFQPVPNRVKDYISFPKPNGYQSLHTAVILDGQMIEVQIRTAAMHQVAEYGMASHWAYIDEKRRGKAAYNTPWLSRIKELQDDMVSARDFVDCVRLELLGKRVFVFLRDGKILNLARGATVIDAAFQIHTEVGLGMHGALINGRPVPLSYELQNGDVISILTGDGRPATDWMRYAKISGTRTKLRSYFRSKEKESLRMAGDILVMDFLRTHGITVQEASYLQGNWTIPLQIEEVKAFLPGKTKYKDMNDLLLDIGKNRNREFLRSVISKLFLVPLSTLTELDQKSRSARMDYKVTEVVEESKQFASGAESMSELEQRSLNSMPSTKAFIQQDDRLKRFMADVDSSVFDEDADSKNVCPTCLPIYGDEIIGTKPVDDEGNEVVNAATTVHRIGCAHAQRAVNREFAGGVGLTNSTTSGTTSRRSRVSRKSHLQQPKEVPVKLQWPSSACKDESSYLTEVVVVAQDRKMLLADLSEIVSTLCEIKRTSSASTEEHATCKFLVEVTSLSHLQDLMDSLRRVRFVMSVEREFGSNLL